MHDYQGVTLFQVKLRMTEWIFSLPPAVPLKEQLPEFRDPLGHTVDVLCTSIPVDKVICEVVHLFFAKRVDQGVVIGGLQIQPVFLRFIEVGAVTVKHDLAHGYRRWKMDQRGNVVGVFPIYLFILSRKANEQIPTRIQIVEQTILEERQILEDGGS